MLVTRIGNEMARAAGPAFAAAFVAASLLGTVGSSWRLGDAMAPTRTGPLGGDFPSPALCLAGLAVVVEALRLVLALQAERVWRRSRFQGFALVAPLWLACTAYCILVPFLLVTIVPTFKNDNAYLVGAAGVAWTFIQIAAGLLPGIGWSTGQTVIPATVAVRAATPAATRAVRTPASSAEDVLRVLRQLVDLPEGSDIGEHGRVGSNREIVISQAKLANLVGRSPPTVRRWLQELERSHRIVRSGAGKETRIHLHPQPYTNGDARALAPPAAEPAGAAL